MGIRYCTKCNGKVSDSRNDCPHCGYTFLAKKTCIDCGEILDINTKECPECGYIFDDNMNKEEKKINLIAIGLPLALLLTLLISNLISWWC